MAGITNQMIQKTLDMLGAKIDIIIDKINMHQQQINTLEDRIQSTVKRVEILEEWRNKGTERANTIHEEMRNEWAQEVKAVNLTMNSLETKFSIMVSELSGLKSILKWILGGFTGILLTVIGGIIVGYATHLIH